MKCARCGTAIQEGARFCIKCGAGRPVAGTPPVAAGAGPSAAVRPPVPSDADARVVAPRYNGVALWDSKEQSHQLLRHAREQEALTIIDDSDGAWLRVRLPEGTEGFVRRDTVREPGANPAAAAGASAPLAGARMERASSVTAFTKTLRIASAAAAVVMVVSIFFPWATIAPPTTAGISAPTTAIAATAGAIATLTGQSAAPTGGLTGPTGISSPSKVSLATMTSGKKYESDPPYRDFVFMIAALAGVLIASSAGKSLASERARAQARGVLFGLASAPAASYFTLQWVVGHTSPPLGIGIQVSVLAGAVGVALAALEVALIARQPEFGQMTQRSAALPLAWGISLAYFATNGLELARRLSALSAAVGSLPGRVVGDSFEQVFLTALLCLGVGAAPSIIGSLAKGGSR